MYFNPSPTPPRPFRPPPPYAFLSLFISLSKINNNKTKTRNTEKNQIHELRTRQKMFKDNETKILLSLFCADQLLPGTDSTLKCVC